MILSQQQFQEHLVKTLGPDASWSWQEQHHQTYDDVPEHVFRVMSEEHYRKSLREGVHTSDQRGAYLGMAQRGEIPKEEAWDEGVTASRAPYTGYMVGRGTSRIVKIAARPEDEWHIHPDYEEGDAFNTAKPVPVSRFEASVKARALRGGDRFEVLP